MKKMKRFYFTIVAFLLIIFIVISGCTTDKKYTSPSKVESTQNEVKVDAKSESKESPTAKPETPKTQTFNIGDIATDNELKVTVNNVKFVSKIDQKDNEFLITEAPSGKQYAIVDITIENVLSDKTQTISTLVETTINDQDGYNYDLDFEGLIALDKAFKDGEILPNMKKRGELAYLVPSDATDLKFIYKFDVFTGTTAIFDIK